MKNTFTGILQELQVMHDRKQADYGTDTDPFANVRASEDFGIPPWIGTLVRANDKMRRLQAAAAGSTLANEGIEDSLIDLAVYAVIALALYREDAGPVPLSNISPIRPLRDYADANEDDAFVQCTHHWIWSLVPGYPSVGRCVGCGVDSREILGDITLTIE